MTTQELQAFIENYTTTDFDCISFKNLGGEGPEFREQNGDFRRQVCELVIPQINQVKLELIRDLYQEEGKISVYTLTCYPKFHLLGQELLTRGGADYLTDYLRGAAHTEATAIASGKIVLRQAKATELLKYFDTKRKKPANEEEAILYKNKYFRGIFIREEMKRKIPPLCYMTPIGFFVAILLYIDRGDKNPVDQFRIRQSLGLYLIGLSCEYIYRYFDSSLFYAERSSLVVLTPLFVFWLMGFATAMRDKAAPFPIVGKAIQRVLGFVG